MIRLYQAANLPEAHLVRHLLAQVGIESHVFNENAQGGAGELPLTETYPEIWLVSETDIGAAREVIGKFEAGRSREEHDRVCPKCGQSNPGGFELCWSCQEVF